MAHPHILDSSRTALLVIDVQEAFRPVIPDFDRLAARIAYAINGFRILEIPIFVSEQYRKGLGLTAQEIRAALPTDFDYLEKTLFSACGAADLDERFTEAGLKQIVICGLETHVCVNQTAHDLLHRGFDVHILTDCVVSRSEHDRETGLAKMLSSGAVRSSVEMAFFELMRDSRHEKFKEMQALIKSKS